MDNAIETIEPTAADNSSAVSTQEVLIRGVLIPAMGVLTVTLTTFLVNRAAAKAAKLQAKKNEAENTTE